MSLDHEHARLSSRLLGKILAEKMPAPDRLTAFRYMAKRFPGKGWETAVAETERLVGRDPHASE